MPKISQIDQVTCQAEVRILRKTTLKFATTALTICWIVLVSSSSFTLSAILTGEFEFIFNYFCPQMYAIISLHLAYIIYQNIQSHKEKHMHILLDRQTQNFIQMIY